MAKLEECCLSALRALCPLTGSLKRREHSGSWPAYVTKDMQVEISGVSQKVIVADGLIVADGPAAA